MKKLCSILIDKGLFNDYVTSRGYVVLIGSVHTNAFSHKKKYNWTRFCTFNASKFVF